MIHKGIVVADRAARCLAYFFRDHDQGKLHRRGRGPIYAARNPFNGYIQYRSHKAQ
ncbi:MAG: hypothetical protein N6V49_13930 [Serratia symbiotica]|nr:hypothetical protein [Serratia symbiotica]